MRKMLQWKVQDLIHQQRRELRIVRMTYCSYLLEDVANPASKSSSSLTTEGQVQLELV